MKAKALLVMVALITATLFLSTGISQVSISPTIDSSKVFKEGYYFRQGEGIYINTVDKNALSISGQPIGVKWGYDKEVVTGNFFDIYKAKMPFWFEHTLPIQGDPCSDDFNFVTDFPTSLEFFWDYNQTIRDYNVYGCDVNGLNCKRNLLYTHIIPRSRWRNIETLASCPLQQNRRYWFRHLAQVNAGQQVIFDVNAVFNFPVIGNFVFVIPEPEWVSTAPADFNTGTGFDFNWTKVTQDGNVMPTGSDRVYVETDQSFYDNNLVGSWCFDDINADGSGTADDTNNGNNGLFVSGADINSAGMWDSNAVFLDGVDDMVAVGNDASLIPLDGRITIMAWVKTSLAGRRQVIVSRQKDSLDDKYSLWIENTSVAKAFFYTQNPATFNNLIGTTTLDTETWYHVAVTWSGWENDVNTMKLYVNGTLDATISTDGSWLSNAGITTHIGNTPGGANDYFEGVIDEVKIYSRELSAEEIAQDYNSWMVDATYTSPVNDAGSTVSWDTIIWKESTDVNNTVSFDYRSCDDSACSGESWTTGLTDCINPISPCSLSASNNQYFQYKVNFDTNSADWNPVRSGANDYGLINDITDVNITYSTVTDSCTCPASGNWEITSGDTCKLTDECNLTGGSFHIVNGSLEISSTGTLTIPTGYKWIMEDGQRLDIEDGGKLVMQE
jgi:hypothetical protein